ncbi:MAG: Maf family protein [Pseudomonadota bacterium]
MASVILASGSSIRATLLHRIGLSFAVQPARIDEEALRRAMQAENASGRDIADQLAAQKAVKVSLKAPGALVIGCDQILLLDREVISKPATLAAAAAQLEMLAGREHRLISAAVIAEDGVQTWRAVTEAKLAMKPLTGRFIEAYLSRNWPGVADSVGAYKLEEEGPRLFRRITGDTFTILGLPLLELCSYLETRGVLHDA